MQNPELPNGCEVTSLSMVLTAAGYPVDKVELYEEFLPAEEFTYSGDYRYGPSPEEAYVGMRPAPPAAGTALSSRS